MLALFAIAMAIVVTVEGVIAQSMSEGIGPWSDSIYSIVSLVVSFAALGFSMLTFHSIDKVNQVASADGGVGFKKPEAPWRGFRL